MSCQFKRLTMSSAIPFALVLGVGAASANVLDNAGFEDGAASWDLGANTFISQDHPNTGLNALLGTCFGADCYSVNTDEAINLNEPTLIGPGVVSQEIQDLSKGIYRLSYFLRNGSDIDPYRVAVSLGDRVIVDGAPQTQVFGIYAPRIDHYSAASGGDTVLGFGFRHDDSDFYLDDVELVMIDDGEGNNIAAVSQSVALQGSFSFLNRIQNRFGRAGSPVSVALNTPVEVADNSGGYVSPTGSMRAYMSGYGDRSKWDDGISSRRWGLEAGVETAVLESLDVGATLSAGHSRFKTDTLFTDNTGHADEYLGAIHAHFSPQSVPLYLTAAAGYGFTSNDLERTSLTDGTVVARGVEATQWLGSVELGYDWKLGKSFTLTPYLRGDAVRLDQDGYTETVLSGTTLLPMTVEAVDQDAARTVLGARGSFDLSTGRRGARLTMGAGWAHEFETDRMVAFSHTSTSSGTGGLSVTFAASTAAAIPDEDSVVAGASVEAPVSDEARIYVGYNGLFASGNDSHGAEAGLRVVW